MCFRHTVSRSRVNAHDAGNGRKHMIGIAHRRERNKMHTVGKSVAAPGGGFDGEAGLADAAHTGDRERTGGQSGQLGEEQGEIVLTTDERRDRAGKSAGSRRAAPVRLNRGSVEEVGPIRIGRWSHTAGLVFPGVPFCSTMHGLAMMRRSTTTVNRRMRKEARWKSFRAYRSLPPPGSRGGASLQGGRCDPRRCERKCADRVRR